MTAPNPFCAEHGRGTINPCGPCRDARLRNALWRVQHGDLSRPVHPRRVSAGDERVVRGRLEDERHLPAVLQREVHETTESAVFDIVEGGRERVTPVPVGVGLGQVEHGSVVVQLDSHGRKRIARRVLTAFAVAAVALWAVAS